MTNPPTPERPSSDRRAWTPMGRAVLSGVRVRDEDIESTKGLHWVGMIFRGLAVLVFLHAAAETLSAIGGPTDVAWRLRFAEALRLAIWSALLWGAGEFTQLCIGSHRELRATRILMARLVHRIAPPPDSGDARPGEGADRRRG